MGSAKFMAIVPEKESGPGIKPGDKVQIKGRITENAQQFSINFVNETCSHPQNITYHFKLIFDERTILVENYKLNGNWMEHLETEFNQSHGRWERINLAYDKQLLENGKNHTNENEVLTSSYTTATTNYSDDNERQQSQLTNSNNSLLLGQNFALEFAFTLDGIYVYVIYDEDRNLVTRYEPYHEFSSILAVLVSGDVEKVTELSFRYA